jgi:hypothetical protein
LGARPCGRTGGSEEGERMQRRESEGEREGGTVSERESEARGRIDGEGSGPAMPVAPASYGPLLTLPSASEPPTHHSLSPARRLDAVVPLVAAGQQHRGRVERHHDSHDVIGMLGDRLGKAEAAEPLEAQVALDQL